MPRKHTRLARAPETPAAALQSDFKKGVALHQQGKLTKAERLYAKVIQAQPRHFGAHHLLGVIALRTGRPERAFELIGKSIAINGQFAPARNDLGNALTDLGRFEEAIASYNQAIALKPDYAAAYRNRGMALVNLRRLDEAIASYDQAIALKPDYAAAYMNRGMAQSVLNRFEDAIASYDKAIALTPNVGEAHMKRGAALASLKRFEEAIDSYDRALALSPELDFLFGMRLTAKMLLCDWTDLEEECALLEQRTRNNEAVSYPFNTLAITSDPSVQAQSAYSYSKIHHTPLHPLPPIPKSERHDKIRVGYYSCEFHEHVASYERAELIELHDRSKFEVIAFSFGPNTNDAMRERLQISFDRFIDVQHHSDDEIALLSRQLEIDIAVDLKGYTPDHRTGIYAHRAAPLQINGFVYAGSMGEGKYFDYIIADKILIPDSSRHYYAEKIVYLPNSYQMSDSKRLVSSKRLSRKELGLPDTGFVFCCLNNNYKITPDIYDVWMRILKHVNGSVLWLYVNDTVARNNLRKEAEQRGVCSECLIFADKLPHDMHLARQRAADLFIDTAPYNAHASANDALWMGLPVLTYTGEAFASRVAASALNAVGLPELITSNQADYEALAIELATNPERLRQIRLKLEKNRLEMPLFDTKLYTRHLEDAYTQMYDRYQQDLTPDHLYING